MPPLADAARVLDALKDPATGYYDPRDPFTAVPKALVPGQPYASFAITDEALRNNAKPLQGLRIGILREHMVKRTLNDEAISDQMDREIKAGCAIGWGELVRRYARLSRRSDGRTCATASPTRVESAVLMPEMFSRATATGSGVRVPGYE